MLVRISGLEELLKVIYFTHPPPIWCTSCFYNQVVIFAYAWCFQRQGRQSPFPCIKLKCSSQLLLFSGLLSTAHPASWNHAEIELFCVRPAFQSLVCDTPLPPFLVWFGFFQVVSNAVEMKQGGMKGCFWVNRGGCPLLSQSHCGRFTWIREGLRMKRGTAIPLIRQLWFFLSPFQSLW